MAAIRGAANGKTLITLVALASALFGIIGGAVTAGVWFGSVRSDLETHLRSVPNIHETVAEKEARIHRIVDREIAPALDIMRKQLERIEEKVDALEHAQ